MRFRRHEEAAEQSTQRLLWLFALVVMGLVVGVNAVLALIVWLTLPFLRGFPPWFFEVNTAMVLLYVVGGCYVESLRLKRGGPHVAELAGARAVGLDGNEELTRRERRFANLVQEMALASGQRPPPQAWVLPRDDAINALAAGWTADDAVVVVTRGALERLTRAELQGVVAHEFGHLFHGDTRLNMRLVGMVWGLQLVWGLGLSLWSEDERGRRKAGALFGLGLMAVGSLGWLAGRLLQAAVSRQREFLADATAVKFTRHVDGLGGALRKIAAQQAQRIHGLASVHAGALAHLLLSGRAEASDSWRARLATHPPLGERLERLYGRPWAADELMLPAPVLPIDEVLEAAAHEAALPATVMAMATAPPNAALASSPVAHAHDATQVPDFHGSAERAREALRRIDLWHGPGEWQAAMLVLAIDDSSPHAAGRWRAYQAATADLNVALPVRAELATLDAAQRREVFALLLQRAGALTPAARQRLWRDWSWRWRQLHGRAAIDSVDAQDRLRLLVMRHALAATATVAPRATLASAAAAVQAATRAMAPTLRLAADDQHAWLTAAFQALVALDMPAPRGPAAGLAPGAADRALHLALAVRRLSPMQTPLLLRAWTEAAQLRGLVSRRHTVDALHLVSVALRLPLPPALQNPQASSV